MTQRVPLDRPGRRLYNALAISAGAALACVTRIESIAPTGLAPMDAAAAAAWAASVRPAAALRYDLTWRYTTQQGSSAGRAAVRYAPPDTVRFDYRGPFGRSGSALIVGDELRWALPADDASSLVPAAPLFWSGIGIPPAPPEGAVVLGKDAEGQRAWRYLAGDQALDLILRDGAPRQLLAELRRGNRIVGAATTSFDRHGQWVAGAKLTFPHEAALLTFTVEALDTLVTFGPETWNR